MHDALPLIDAHLHLRTAKAIPRLGEIIRRSCLRQVTIQCLPPYPPWGAAQNAVALLAKARLPGACYVFGGLHHHGPAAERDFAGQAARLIAAGCDGVKMLEGKPDMRRLSGLPLDAPAYDAYYAYLEAARIPITFHVADPEYFWEQAEAPSWVEEHGWAWWKGDYPSKAQMHAEADGVLAKFPRLRVIFAHFNFQSADLERASRFLDRWPQVSFDLAPASEMYGNFSTKPATWRDFFTAYQDRLIFGTDILLLRGDEPVEDACERIALQRRFLETDEDFSFMGLAVRGLALDRPVAEKICMANFRRYAGSEPKPVDIPLAIEECRRALALAESRADNEGIAEARDVLAQLEALG